jgi:PAS domain S-box-containing protein
MIWASIPLMIVLDLVVIGCVVTTLVFLWRRRTKVPSRNIFYRFGILALGLSLLALFHIAGLVTMTVFPLFMAKSAAMAAMENLHLDYGWITSLFGIGIAAIGLMLAVQSTLGLNGRLGKSEERFRRAFENSGIGMTIRNEQDRTLVTNDAFRNMLGYSEEELQALHFSDITHPEDRHENKKFRRKLLDGDADNVQVTKRYIRKNGEPIWLINEMSAVRDADGQQAYTINLFQDITDRKLAEEEAAKKSALLESTIETMAQGYVVYDADLRLAAFNAQYERMFGYPSDFLRPGLPLEDVIRNRGLRWRKRIGSSNEDRIKRHVKRAKEPVERTQERNLTDGLTYIYHRKPLPGGGFITTYTDITERKRVEQEAAEQSRLLEATFQKMVQGIAVYDADHMLVAFNPQYAEIMGLPPDYLYTGMYRGDIFRYRVQQGHFDDADVEATVAERLTSAKQPESSERTLPNGRSYSYELTPTADSGYIITLTDVTERREAEKQLQQALKMEAVGQLTGGIAHDFNNLLAVSLGNVELAEETVEEGGDVRPFLETIKRASERGASLTNQLLAFSRKQTLFPQVIDAGELVGGMAGLLRSALGETIEINVASDDDIWPCEVDPSLLESAVLNLALNARDAMSEGGTLTLQATNVSLDDDYAAAQAEVEPGAYVMVAVTDTGTGMPQDVIDHAFDPFFTTKEVGRGSGLGLSMVYGFVKQSGGQVTVYSEEGKGTTIKLYLPRSGTAEGQLGWADQADVPEARGETVMVVEDDPDVRTLSVALLRSFGYEILEAADAKTALKALESAPRVNLLFTDVVLPGGMSGPELALEVQSRFPGIAVLFTSGYTELANINENTFADDKVLLQKPYRKADLARNVRLALDQAQLELRVPLSS